MLNVGQNIMARVVQKTSHGSIQTGIVLDMAFS